MPAPAGSVTFVPRTGDDDGVFEQEEGTHYHGTAELIARLQQRDMLAFEELVRGYQQRVRGFLSTMLIDDAAVDDVAQDVFLEAARSVRRYKGDASLSTWLMAIARHRAYRHIRTEQRLRRRHALAETVGFGAAGCGLDPEALRRLRICMDMLAPSARSVIDQHYFEGQSLAAIAARTGRKESTLRMMLMRVRRSLRGCFEGAALPDLVDR